MCRALFWPGGRGGSEGQERRGDKAPSNLGAPLKEGQTTPGETSQPSFRRDSATQELRGPITQGRAGDYPKSTRQLLQALRTRMRRSSKCFKIIHRLILPFNKSCKCLGLSFSDEVTETQRRKIIVLKVPKSKSVGAKVCTQHSACPLRTGIPHWGHATPPHRFRTNRSFPLLTDRVVLVTTCSLIKDNFTYRESIQGIE